MHEDEERILNAEEAQEIITYAVHLGCMLTLMKHSPKEGMTAEERAEAYEELIDWLYSNMPESLVPISHSMAMDYIDKHVEMEEAIDEFREELKRL